MHITEIVGRLLANVELDEVAEFQIRVIHHDVLEARRKNGLEKLDDKSRLEPSCIASRGPFYNFFWFQLYPVREKHGGWPLLAFSPELRRGVYRYVTTGDGGNEW